LIVIVQRKSKTTKLNNVPITKNKIDGIFPLQLNDHHHTLQSIYLQTPLHSNTIIITSRTCHNLETNKCHQAFKTLPTSSSKVLPFLGQEHKCQLPHIHFFCYFQTPKYVFSFHQNDSSIESCFMA
jgi:hypothetical protein